MTDEVNIMREAFRRAGTKKSFERLQREKVVLARRAKRRRKKQLLKQCREIERAEYEREIPEEEP